MRRLRRCEESSVNISTAARPPLAPPPAGQKVKANAVYKKRGNTWPRPLVGKHDFE